MIVAVVPSYDGRALLGGCLEALRGQGFDELIVVDDASRDGSVAWLRAEHPDVRVIARERNGGFARAAQDGIDAAAGADWIALVNSDVVLAPGWLAAARAAGEALQDCGSVATRMLAPDGSVDDAGDALRRDGAVEQRGRGRPDGPRFAADGEAWGACAGAALYRGAALRAVGGLDVVYVNYLEDAELALRLRLRGYRCAYAAGAVSTHLGSASAGLLSDPVAYWTARNTLLLVARWFPPRWLAFVAYRQLSWLRAAARGGTLRAHLRGLAAGLRAVPAALRARDGADVASVVPARPWHGPDAGGHAEAPQ